MGYKRVLLTTYHQAFLAPGGGEAELVDMAARLRGFGMQADIYGSASQPLSQYDLVLHFSAHGGGEALLQQVKDAGKPVVLLPNLALNQIHDGDRPVIERHFALADRIVFRTACESAAAQTSFGLSPDVVRTVPLAVDPCFGEQADEHIFPVVYGGERDYLLWVGILEERKNQLQVIEALKDLDMAVIFVGAYRDRAYYEACQKAAPAHFKFVPHLTSKSEALRSAYQNCRAYMELPGEPPGLSALEAGLAGAPLLLTDCDWSREYFGDDAVLVDSTSPDAIRKGVQAVLQRSRSTTLSDRIRANYVAPKPLEGLLEIFAELL